MTGKKSLKFKLMSGFLVIGVITFLVGGIGFYSAVYLNNDIEEIAEVRLPSVVNLLVISEGQTAILAGERGLLNRRMFYDNDTRNGQINNIKDAWSRIDAAWKVYEPLPHTKEEAEVWKEFVPAWAKYRSEQEKYMAQIEQKIRVALVANPNQDQIAELDNDIFAQSNAVRTEFYASERLLNQLIEINDNSAHATAAEANAMATAMEILVGIITVFGFFLALVIGFMLTRTITNALKQTVDALQSSSQQIGSASTQLASASQELSSSSNEQASSIEETSSSLEQMAGMIENNVSNAQQAYELSDKVRNISEEGNECMEKLTEAMSEILKSNEKIEDLVKVIGNIGEKTQVMDEIVFQTKLLSFNASVEAERAGEHGRGFAVVAQEVGNLAQMSGKSAQEIADIVKSSIKEAEAITTENKKKVEVGSQYVHDTGNSLKEIMEAAGTVSHGAKQVLDASQDQSKGIEQINAAMSQVDKATQENASTAEETASSSEELSAQVEALNQVVQELVEVIEGSSSHGYRAAGGQGYTPANHKTTTSHHNKVVSLKDKTTPYKSKGHTFDHKLKKASGSDIASMDDEDAWQKL